MNSKQTNIVILLVIIAIAIFVVLQFFGLGNLLGGTSQEATPVSGTQAIVNEIQTTGTVADLRMETVVQGTGEGAVAGDTVTVNYTGILPDGTVFDASANHGQAFSFTLGAGAVIEGWDKGLVGMKKGEKRLLAIPPSMGYGANAVGSIPANSTLIFEVEMLDIAHPAQ